MNTFEDARDSFFRNRFGLFIHWGLYALRGWHEQHQQRLGVARAEYEKLRHEWNPVHFDPDAWLDLAERVGMQYLCVTTKHHDGFCLWNTAQSAFNVTNTPDGRDVVGLLAEACQRRGMPLCLYYSVADWHHPNYPNQGRHHELPPQPGDEPNWAKYMTFLKAQVYELCTNYGPIHGFWWDMNVPEAIDESVNSMIRKLQPQAVINDRGFDRGDFSTRERDDGQHGDHPITFDRPTEGCQSVGMESWGYREDEDYYTDRHLMRCIDKYLARGANYLLNVGPMADGRFDERATALLERIGQWYANVRESFEDVAPASHLTDNRNVLLTRRDNTLYVHLYTDPIATGVKLAPITATPRSATLLNDGSAVSFSTELLPSEFRSGTRCLRLRGLPVNETANTVMVIKLEFDELPEAVDHDHLE
ncbi:MAG: alpha-L-fucosidase [Phycisphaeraceae bacterium]